MCKLVRGCFLFHSEFDKLDKLVNQLYGGGSIHTAYGIMLREISLENSFAKFVTCT